MSISSAIKYQIDRSYMTAVEEYQPDSGRINIDSTHYDKIIYGIGSAILAANDQRASFAKELGEPSIPLRHACYVITKHQDTTLGRDTRVIIREASVRERQILNDVIEKLAEGTPAEKDNAYIFNKLIKGESNLESADLMPALLLFGMPIIHRYTQSGELPSLPSTLSVPQLQEMLRKFDEQILFLRTHVQENPNDHAMRTQLEKAEAMRPIMGATLERLRATETAKNAA